MSCFFVSTCCSGFKMPACAGTLNPACLRSRERSRTPLLLRSATYTTGLQRRKRQLLQVLPLLIDERVKYVESTTTAK